MTQQKKKPKQLYLTETERSNVLNRSAEMNRYEYMKQLVNNDIVRYLKEVVYKRLNLDPGKDYPLSPDTKYLIVENEGEGEKEKTNEKPKPVQAKKGK